jgi:uncharacterized membrane protein YeaQ/YmgE (transglycosylase-associated protein family)
LIIAIVMGVVAGLLVKALFLKDSHIVYDVAFGAIGGLAAYFLNQNLTADVAQAVFALGTAVVIAGLLHAIWSRLAKTA